MANSMTTIEQATASRSPRARSRCGVSLIELLVVITIMLIITAAAIPTMAPAMANRRIRETARLTSSFISGARARAIENGRPVGVQLEPLDGVPGASLLISYVETPPPYCGDTTTSTVAFNAGDPTSGWPVVANPGGDSLLAIVRPGDMVRLGYQGHMFRIDAITGSPPNIWKLSSETVPPANMVGVLNANHPPLPYQVYRQPIRSASAPLQLPESLIVDVSASGVGSAAFGPITGPVVITFAPTGAVSTVSIPGLAPFRPTSSIYLLIGQRSKLPLISYANGADPADSAKKYNFRDLQNLWVSINPQSGLVTTSPVAVVSPSTNSDLTQRFYEDVANSRLLARDAQTLGGK